MKAARLKIILSTFIGGTISIFIKNIDLTSAEIAMFRSVIAVAALLIFKYIKKQSFAPVDKKELRLLVISGALLGLHWMIFFEALKYTTVSVATLCYYFSPVLITICCSILFKEKLGKMQIFCLLMANLGLVLVIDLSGFGLKDSNSIGVALGLTAATFYTAVVMLNKKISSVEGIDRTLIQFLAAIATLMPYCLAITGIHIAEISASGLIFLLIFGLIHTALPYFLFFSTLKELPGQEVALLCYVDPLTAVVVSTFFLHESTSFIQLLGGSMILLFTLFNELYQNKKSR